MSEKMTYEEWYNKNEEEIWIELAEIGADREMDFNSEVEFNNRYEDYLNKTTNIKIIQHTTGKRTNVKVKINHTT